jgi:hypothetical protein
MEKAIWSLKSLFPKVITLRILSDNTMAIKLHLKISCPKNNCGNARQIISKKYATCTITILQVFCSNLQMP